MTWVMMLASDLMAVLAVVAAFAGLLSKNDSLIMAAIVYAIVAVAYNRQDSEKGAK